MTIACGHPVVPFFEPRSVAVIGASRTGGKPGNQQVVNLCRGYPGRVFPINPRASEICGLPRSPSLLEVAAPVDLAILLLPASEVPAAVQACVEKGVPAVLIESAGFAETGAAGQKLQEDLVAVTRGTATRVWGPNCNGLVNASLPLLASFIVDGIMVQEMIPGGREVIVGLSRTDHYGAALMLGLGGVLVEAMGEVVFRLPPIGQEETERMIRESRVGLLLGAHRGRPAADMEAVRGALLALSTLAEADLGLAQVDINPFVVFDQGLGALAVDALVALDA
jgi:acyl-CoA synthetase (NDP forming)